MTIKIICNTCDTIEESCKQSVKLASENNEDVVFEFNGIELRALPESDPNKLIDDYVMRYTTIFSDTLSIKFFDKVNMESLLPRYIGIKND
jgi:hypothetical protein